jgi:hypothetical protein
MPAGELRFLDPTDKTARHAWDEAVKAFPGGTVFHTTAWMDVIEKGFGIPARFAYLANADGSVRALVPLFRAGSHLRPQRWLNLPQSCPSDPLAADAADATALLQALTAAAAQQDASVVVLQTSRTFEPPLPDGWELHREQPAVRHLVDLSGVKDVLELPRLHRKLRQQIRAARRKLAAGEYGIHHATARDVEAFAREVHRILLIRHGHLGPPVSLLQALSTYLPYASRLTLYATQSGHAGAFQISVSDRSTCRLLYGCGLSTPDGSALYRLAIAEEMEAALRAGLHSIDFGETTLSQEGLVSFKESWGAQPADGGYLVIARQGAASGLRNASSSALVLVQRLFHYMPVDVSLRIAGPVHRALQ